MARFRFGTSECQEAQSIFFSNMKSRLSCLSGTLWNLWFWHRDLMIVKSIFGTKDRLVWSKPGRTMMTGSQSYCFHMFIIIAQLKIFSGDPRIHTYSRAQKLSTGWVWQVWKLRCKCRFGKVVKSFWKVKSILCHLFRLLIQPSLNEF